MQVLRTPEDRFTDLPDFDYLPRYADLGGLRMAYVAAGPPGGEPVHAGQPGRVAAAARVGPPVPGRFQ